MGECLGVQITQGPAPKMSLEIRSKIRRFKSGSAADVRIEIR